jgi:hypothetical protein
LHPGQVERLASEKLAQRLTLVSGVVPATNLQAESGVLEAGEERAACTEGARLDDLAQLVPPSWYLRA